MNGAMLLAGEAFGFACGVARFLSGVALLDDTRLVTNTSGNALGLLRAPVTMLECNPTAVATRPGISAGAFRGTPAHPLDSPR